MNWIETGITRANGDHYAGTGPVAAFAKLGIRYEQNAAPKSDIYRDLLPQLNSGKVELLDNQRLLGQLCALERRTSRAGITRRTLTTIINAAAGALTLAVSARPPMRITPEILAAAARPEGWRVGHHFGP